jgi:hypothetical protein
MLTYRFWRCRDVEELISGVLSGNTKVDWRDWANLFHAEAEENLRRFVETVRIECPTSALTSVEESRHTA